MNAAGGVLLRTLALSCCCCAAVFVPAVHAITEAATDPAPPAREEGGGGGRRWAVSWNAPLLSGSGYGSEALAAVAGLGDVFASPPYDLSRNWTVAVNLAHGDAVNDEYAASLPVETRRFLQAAAREQLGLIHGVDVSGMIAAGGGGGVNGAQDRPLPLAPERTIVVCHSEPGAWSLPESSYRTEPCPPRPPPPGGTRRNPEGGNPTAEEPTTWHAVVGRTMFETDRLPTGWSDRLNALDEVWVPTEHHRKIFVDGGVTATKVTVVGQGIDVDRWDPQKVEPLKWKAVDKHGACNEGDYRFLSVFKWEGRKAPDVLVPAFWRAFPPPIISGGESPGPGACLIIVTSLFHQRAREVIADLETYWEIATNRTGDDFLSNKDRRKGTGVVLLSNVPADDLVRLYRTVDAFVLPSRGEGWGRPYMEAMAMGLPVVATNWSGPTEFVNDENGYLLPIKGMVDAGLEAFPGHMWADPDGAALEGLLRRLTGEGGPEEGRARGERARRDVVERWSQEVVARDIARHLERIARDEGPPREWSRLRVVDGDTGGKNDATAAAEAGGVNEEL